MPEKTHLVSDLLNLLSNTWKEAIAFWNLGNTLVPICMGQELTIAVLYL